jgi:DNA replication and repair protein RecF
MYLSNLTVFNFKNYEEGEFSFSSNANAFTGLNGSGKTNMLDAIHYLCLCKSFFNSTDTSNIKHGESFFSIKGIFETDEQSDEILIATKSGQKKSIKRNLKEYTRIADHIGIFPIVMVAPADQELITGGSEERRKLMDSIICQYNASYLDSLMSYNRVLLQRNTLLKQASKSGVYDATLFQVWEEQLETFANKIFEIRSTFIENFIPYFNKFYSFLTQDKEVVSIRYISQLKEHSLSDLLLQNAHRDRVLQYTTVGIHKDDLELLLNNHAVKKIGSQGQQKSFVLALKLAQFELMRQTTGKKPILLLDDIFDKLDINRITRLMELVSNEQFGQIFITDTNEIHIQQIFDSIKVPLKIFRTPD